MGEVYKARDTRLDRTVALKVLPAHLSSDDELRVRFEREARAISALSHPNICTLFDIGNADGQAFLVMEYLEGQTLAERLTHGPLPLDEVLRIGTVIADALEKAHRLGIIHRDLKPGNIVLTRAGAKLLDFGLAKWLPSEGSLIGRSDEATQRQPLTTQGTLLGTIPYMAPEQLEGKEADRRTDIFAFGAVLYEMATGVRAFNASSNASLIAAIMREDPPPPSQLRELTPRGLDAIIRTCLAKDPDDRFQSPHDVKLALELVAGGAGELQAQSHAKRRAPWLAPALVVALLAALLYAYFATHSSAAPEERVYRFSVSAPNGSTYPGLGEGGGFALSPDGRRLAFEATTPDGRTFLWLRALDSENAELLAGSEGGEYPFWSPDGRSLAFFADGKLKRADLPNGPTLTLCNAPSGRGGAWSRKGTILFAPTSTGTLFQVPSAGGTPLQVTSAGKDTYSHRFPVFLDDERFLFTVQSPQRPSSQGVFASSLGSHEMKRVLSTPLSVSFAAPDQLFHVREHMLVRQRFDPASLELEGEPAVIAGDIYYYEDRSYVPATAAAGTVAFRRNGVANMRITWYDRDGRRLATHADMGEYEGITVSPDGTRVAFGYFDRKESMNHIAIAAIGNAIPRRFTFTHGNQYSPVWSPDLQRVAFSDDYKGIDTLTEKPLTGTGNERPLITRPPTPVYALSWSADGGTILYRSEDANGGYDVQALSLAAGKPVPYLDGPSDETHAQFSPDGNWVAYTSTESERPEVYVQPFPATGAKWQVSTSGGEQPRWRRDGKELFYIAPDRRLMSVPVRVPGAFDEEPPRPLFATHIPFGDVGVSHAYDVSADGQRFVIAAADPLTPQTGITVVSSWR
jgi:Tol biopolymer transport system component